MNIFVLSTGRTASTTFSKACSHIENYSFGHESLRDKISHERLNYPDNHIEVDNRLSFFLGSLDQKYGNSAFYVHLLRNSSETASSFNKRWQNKHSIIKAYAYAINFLQIENLTKREKLNVCKDYVNITNANIGLFLKDKSKVLEINVSTIKEDFEFFWNSIGAKGDINKALDEFNVKYNPSLSTENENVVLNKNKISRRNSNLNSIFKFLKIKK
ncbi:hypothetical protein [Lutimonas vermicola]|uniref:Sulfotransferase family protein n=1 Tax=Lutimonas vermicola TaxID=414288 RepID=A0ABU9KXW3_9FLAO